MTATLLVAAEETHTEGGINPLWAGVGAGVVLLTLLFIVLIFGQGRPHA
jgi:hypothetical protein